MAQIPEKYIPAIEASLDLIRKEMDRLYWNKYQKEMVSPFDNTGEKYINDTFVVRAYDWGEDGNSYPNFQYKRLDVFWYKYSCRGLEAWFSGDFSEFTIDFLVDMLNDCLLSLRKDFGEI